MKIRINILFLFLFFFPAVSYSGDFIGYVDDISASPNGKELIFAGVKFEGSSLYKISSEDESHIKCVDSYAPGDFIWSPDGKNISFVKYEFSTPKCGYFTGTLNLETCIEKDLGFIDTGSGTEIRWSPIDVNLIAFIRCKYRSSDIDGIWISNLDGSSQKKLVDFSDYSFASFYQSFQWSPDGKEIYYAFTTKKNKYQFWVIGIQTLERRLLFEIKNKEVEVEKPELLPSPNGKWIIATELSFLGDSFTYLFDVKKNSGKKIFDRHFDNISWSPDGEKAVFCESTGGDGKIFTMDFDKGIQKDIPIIGKKAIWTSNDKLIILSGKKTILVTNSDGTGSKQIFPEVAK